MSLSALPYDLLFNIAQYLAIDDIHNLQGTCKSLRAFTLTRPVYRTLAHGLLARSRPLPLPAFQRLSDLSTDGLIKAVNRAYSFESAWRVRAPRPARSQFSLSASSSAPSEKHAEWYTKISAPPNEEIDWLSPITSSYTLCATKSGRVICWDVARDVCLAEWDPRTLSAQRDSGGSVPKDDGHKADRLRLKENGDAHDDGSREEVDAEKKWELWKCRVEFDERAVYFTMARVLEGSYDDNRVMEFVLMKLAFPPEAQDCPSPSSQNLLFSPEPHYNSPKSPESSPPPSSQASSPQDSTHQTSSAYADSICATRSPLSARPTPLPDCSEYHRQVPTHTTCLCAASTCQTFPGGRFASAGDSLRSGLLFETPLQHTLELKPVFFPLTSFHTTGVVMNVFLLDPPRRLLSAFVWVATSNTIGLYVLLDWAKDEYIFVDTGVGCLISSNWSCILHEDQIVIHSEEADAAYQHFYPLNILRNFVKPRKPSLLVNRIHKYGRELGSRAQSHNFRRDDLPVISMRLSPIRSISKKFIFPSVQSSSVGLAHHGTIVNPDAESQETHEGTDSASPAAAEHPISGPSTITSAIEEFNEREAFFDDISECETEEEDRWSQEAVTEGSESKGKGRANFEDAVDDHEPGPSSKAARDKGKMREVILQQDPNRDAPQPRPSPHQSSPGTSHSSSSASTIMQLPAPSHTAVASSSAPNLNPYPFPPWYPESAHFVRQWWPTLPGVPRLSCTVVLLATHDAATHRTRFVLAQHYFRVPIINEPPMSNSPTSGAYMGGDGDDEMLHLWYVSTPFEVVCVLDGAGDNDDDEETTDRPRPLVAVDFGHAVWVEYAAEPGGVYGVDASQLVGNDSYSDYEDGREEEEEEAPLGSALDDPGSASASSSRHRRAPEDQSTNPHDGDGTIYDPRRHRVPKCLRFVTFPPVFTALDRKLEKGRLSREEAVVRTLEIPEELDLDGVETINIDQSQGAVILSVKEGKIFILRYE